MLNPIPRFQFLDFLAAEMTRNSYNWKFIFLPNKTKNTTIWHKKSPEFHTFCNLREHFLLITWFIFQKVCFKPHNCFHINVQSCFTTYSSHKCYACMTAVFLCKHKYNLLEKKKSSTQSCYMVGATCHLFLNHLIRK